MKRTYPLLIEQGDKGLFGHFPDLPGLVVAGDTREEVVALARDFMRDYLADYTEKGAHWPDPSPTIALALVEIDEAEVMPQAAKAEAR
jgi:predicted RNase H-like HicB family nuclease